MSLFDDMEALREANAGIAKYGVKRHFSIIPVGKPHKQDFVRTHTDPGYQIDINVLHLKETNEVYVLHQGMEQYLKAESEVTFVRLWAAVNRAGDPLLWMLKLGDNKWHTSALGAAEEAREQWVKLEANISAGYYSTYIAEGDLGEPQWPEDLDFSDWLKKAFQDKEIDTPDHPVLQKLNGRI